MLHKEAIVSKFRFDEVILRTADMLPKGRMCFGWKEYVRGYGNNQSACLDALQRFGYATATTTYIVRVDSLREAIVGHGIEPTA